MKNTLKHFTALQLQNAGAIKGGNAVPVDTGGSEGDVPPPPKG